MNKKIQAPLKTKVMSTYENIFTAGEQKGEQIGLQKGEQIGLQKGEEIGLQKGEEIGLQKVITLGHAQGFSVKSLAKLTGLSEERVQNIIDNQIHE